MVELAVEILAFDVGRCDVSEAGWFADDVVERVWRLRDYVLLYDGRSIGALVDDACV